jgi:hypothetical protein
MDVSIYLEKKEIMQYILDTNYYRNIVAGKTKEELIKTKLYDSSKVLFPTIVSLELINHLAIDDNARADCLNALSLLFHQSSEICNGKATGNVVPTFYDLLTLYFFSKESKHFGIANKTLMMSKNIFENRYQSSEFLEDVEKIKRFKNTELENIISNLEKYYLSSFNENQEINWKVFRENIELGDEFSALIKNGNLNKLFGLSLLKLAIEGVENPNREVSKDYFVNQFLKDFEISIDFFVYYILRKLISSPKPDRLKDPKTDSQKNWNSFYDFQLIFTTEFENSKGRETIFVTQEDKIRSHFDKFKKGHLTLSIDEYKNKC